MVSFKVAVLDELVSRVYRAGFDELLHVRDYTDVTQVGRFADILQDALTASWNGPQGEYKELPLLLQDNRAAWVAHVRKRKQPDASGPSRLKVQTRTVRREHSPEL